MLGLPLSRQGLDVQVLEKHGGSLRDVRDTIHPSTVHVLAHLALARRMPRLEQGRASRPRCRRRARFTVVDVSHLRTPRPHITFVPQ